MDKPRAITELLQRSGFPAEGVMQRGQFLHRLNRLLASLLDHDAKLHCQVGNIRDGVLIIYVDSSAWASRMHYQSPALLAQLQQRKGLAALQQIEIRVMPRQQKEKHHQRATLSLEAASCLRLCADSIADADLRQALQRLAAHHKKRTGE
jgi:hypothetical protein